MDNEDITTLIKEAGAYIDTIIIPKVGCRADLYAADVIITQTCRMMGLDRIITMEGLIESAAGVMAINDIAGYNRYIGAHRLEALHFGAGDYAATIRSPTISIGGAIPDYPGDIWHYPLSAMVAACHSNGVVPMDSAYGDFNDPDGYMVVAKRARALGMAGKWAIHPSQIALANATFTPDADAIARAEAMIKALEESEAAGAGAVMYDGQMIDAASTRMAENIVAMARMLKSHQR
jgi:citrate lyase subunit beta/citryl-CoA lyase